MTFNPYSKITDWNAAYSNRDYIANSEQILNGWVTQSTAFRKQIEAMPYKAHYDLEYGDNVRQCYDLFLPESKPQALVIFIHGGYWRAFSKNEFSHLAKGALSHNIAMAMPSYRLCPEVTISQITEDCFMAIQKIANQITDIPIMLVGHSAGGHLVSRMLCKDVYSKLSKSIQKRLRVVIAISGLFDLRPLLKTDMNKDFALDDAMALKESPIFYQPSQDQIFYAWVGAQERPEFIRQSQLIAASWGGLCANMVLNIEEPHHHFSVIEGLEKSDSPLVNCLLSTLD